MIQEDKRCKPFKFDETLEMVLATYIYSKHTNSFKWWGFFFPEPQGQKVYKNTKYILFIFISLFTDDDYTKNIIR